MTGAQKLRRGFGILGAFLLLAGVGRSPNAPEPIQAYYAAICAGSLFPAQCLLVAASIRPGDEEARVLRRVQGLGRLTVLEDKTQRTLWLHDGDTDCLDCDENSSAWLLVTIENGRVVEANTKIFTGS